MRGEGLVKFSRITPVLRLTPEFKKGRKMETICSENLKNQADLKVSQVNYNEDRFLMHALRHVPTYAIRSFSDKQLKWLKYALEMNNREAHCIDYRGSIGLLNWHYYFVILAGKDKRKSKRAGHFGRYVTSLFMTCFLIVAAICWIVVMDIIFDMGISNALFFSI